MLLPQALSVIRRGATVSVIVSYLTATVWFGWLHVLGDSGVHPIAYFFTWDMFPSYRTQSTRCLVVGRTRSGSHVQLLPGPTQSFRWGLSGSATRIDIDRNHRFLRLAAEHALEKAQVAQMQDPFARVFVIEEYWPPRFNFNDRLYQAVYNEPNPRRRYWRILDEFKVTVDDFAGT